jgi:glutamate/tyrosine decarboxylase-like PLP-dependent enzyme
VAHLRNLRAKPPLPESSKALKARFLVLYFGKEGYQSVCKTAFNVLTYERKRGRINDACEPASDPQADNNKWI